MTSDPESRLPEVPERVRRAYELGRARTAAIGALPALLYLGAAMLVGVDAQAVVLAVAMFVFAALGVYRGRPWSRGVGLGFVLGVIPFGVAGFAQGAGHMCLDGACMAVCMPACAAAGVATGLLGSWLVVRVRGGLGSFVSLATLVTLAGAMGCRCIGYGSVSGLVVGLLIASVPAMPRLLADTRRLA